MSIQQKTTILKTFQKTPVRGKLRQEYLSMFEKRMAYRTTKSENPEVTKKMVDTVFRKLNRKRNG